MPAVCEKAQSPAECVHEDDHRNGSERPQDAEGRQRCIDEERNKDKDARARFKLLAQSTMMHATATARRLRNSAENAADSYARAMKKVLEEAAKKSAGKKQA